MTEAPRITQSDAQRIARIHLVIKRDEIQRFMAPGLHEVLDTITAQGIAPAGPWFTHHLRMSPEGWDFAICVPVAVPVTPVGRVQPGEMPTRRVVRTIHRGPYEGLFQAWSELDAWIAAQGLQPATDLWECYVLGPESNPDPATWRTELNRPLLD